MAIDTGLTTGGHTFRLVLSSGLSILQLKIHPLLVMTAAALSRIGCLHNMPDPLRHDLTTGSEFFRGIDCPHQAVIDIGRRLHLGQQLGQQRLGDMAVRTGRYNAGCGFKMRRLTVLLVHRIPHLVAADTERFAVGEFKCGIEPTPKQNTQDSGQIAAKGDAEAIPAFGYGPESVFISGQRLITYCWLAQ